MVRGDWIRDGKGARGLASGRHAAAAEAGTIRTMKRAVIVGPGASGKSTLALRLGRVTGLPVIELDKVFWRPDLTPTPRDKWTAI